MSQRLRNNTRRNEAESQKNRIPKKPNSCLRKQRPGHGNAEHSVSRTLTNNKGHRQIGKQFQNITRTLSDPNGAVVNLSNKKFTKHEFELLNKNLNFCPRPNQFNKSNFKKDLQVFFRRVKLKAHFQNNQPYEPSEEDLFGPPKDSTWTPKYVNYTVQTFIAAVSKDFENFKGKKLPNE